MDYISNENCANCWGKRYGFEEVGVMDSERYMKQIRYMGVDVWGILRSIVSERR